MKKTVSVKEIADKRRTREQKEREAVHARAEREKTKKVRAEQKAKAAIAKKVSKKEREARREKQRNERIAQANARLKKRREVYAKLGGKMKNIKAGFDYKNHGVLPRAEFEADGDRASIAMRLSSADIKCYRFRTLDGKTVFEIRKKDTRKVIAILNEMCYNYRISAIYGIGRLVRFCAARFGLLLGAAVSAVGLNIAYGYVWRVEVYGNDKLSDSAVLSVLNGVGVSIGCKKSVIDDNVAATLVKADGIVDCACEIVGTTLKVHLIESTDYSVHGTCEAYASKYDATVTRVVMRSGTALVKRGDVVSSGELLARGEVYGTTGELLYTKYCDADIYGNVSLTFSADIGTTGIEYKRTGNSKRRTVIDIFGLEIGNTESPYASYETVVHTANYDVLLPLYVKTYDYYETSPVEVTRDIDEVAKRFAEDKIEELRFVGDFEYNYTVTERFAGLYTVHVFLSGETLISTGTTAPPLDLTDPEAQEQ